MKFLLLFALVVAGWAAPIDQETESILEVQDIGLWGGDMAGIENEQDAIDIHNAITDKRMRWPGGIMPYQFDSGVPARDRSIITNAMNQFNSKVQCLRAVPRTNQQHYVRVIRGNGCYSFVGCLFRGPQDLSLGPGCVFTGTIQHEFLHAAGFQHEHQREDRDAYITVQYQNIRQGLAYAFNKIRTDYQGTGYDYASIMHYGRTAFSSNGRPTIVPKQNVRIGINAMSPVDIDRVRRLYC